MKCVGFRAADKTFPIFSGHVGDWRQKITGTESETRAVRAATKRTLHQTCFRQKLMAELTCFSREKELAKVTIKKEDVELIVSPFTFFACICFGGKNMFPEKKCTSAERCSDLLLSALISDKAEISCMWSFNSFLLLQLQCFVQVAV